MGLLNFSVQINVNYVEIPKVKDMRYTTLIKSRTYMQTEAKPPNNSNLAQTNRVD